MANMRAIRNRIKSIESTRQITRSMRMVAASKLRRTQEQLQRLDSFSRVSREVLQKLLPALEALSVWDDESLLAAMTALAEELGVKNAKVMWPVRIAAAGKAVTPGGATEICRILGRDETLRRFRIALDKLG